MDIWESHPPSGDSNQDSSHIPYADTTSPSSGIFTAPKNTFSMAAHPLSKYLLKDKPEAYAIISAFPKRYLNKETFDELYKHRKFLFTPTGMEFWKKVDLSVESNITMIGFCRLIDNHLNPNKRFTKQQTDEDFFSTCVKAFNPENRDPLSRAYMGQG